jgi:hypothetical protein
MHDKNPIQHYLQNIKRSEEYTIPHTTDSLHNELSRYIFFSLRLQEKGQSEKNKGNGWLFLTFCKIFIIVLILFKL